MAKNAKLLEELVIKVNSRALKQAVKDQNQLGDRLEDSAAGAELLNEQLNTTNAALAEARKLSRGLANQLEGVGAGANMQDYFDGVVAAIQDVEGTISELSASFEEYTHIAKQGNDEVVLTLERLLDPLRKVDQQTKKTAASTQKMQEGLSVTGDSQARASKGIEGLQRSTKGGTRAFQDLAKIAGPLPVVYATIAANVYALTEAYNQLAAGDRLNRLEKINSVIGQEQGTAISTLARVMQEATGYALSFEGAMQKAAQASAYGFSSEQVKEFTLAARRASVALGVDLDDAMNRIIRGVSKLEIELLDELGITVRLTEAYEKFQRNLGISQTALTGYQKQQAYANAVIEESTRRFGQLDQAMKATGWEKLAASTDQAVKSGQKYAANVLEPIALKLAELLEEDKIITLREELERIAEAQQKASGNGKFLEMASLQEQADITIKDSLQEIAEETKKLEAAQKQLQQADPTSSYYANLELKVIKLKKSIQDMNQTLERQKTQFSENASATGLFQGNLENVSQKYQQFLQQYKQFDTSAPEIRSIFEASIKPQKAPAQDIANMWAEAISNYEHFQDQITEQDRSTEEGRKSFSNQIEQQENILRRAGMDTPSQLYQAWQQATEAVRVHNEILNNTANTQQKINKDYLFQQGVTAELKQNQQEIQEIEQQLYQNTKKFNGSGERLISQEKELELETRKIALQSQALTLTQQQNNILGQQQTVLADTQYQQALLNNQDPLRQRLKLTNDQIAQQQELINKSRGLTKPEDMVQLENQLQSLLVQRRDALRAIRDEEIQIQLAKQETAKYETILQGYSSNRLAEGEQELQLLKDTQVALQRKLELANKNGDTESSKAQIANEIHANNLKILQQQEQLTKTKFEQMEAELDLSNKSRGLSEVDALTKQVELKKQYIQQLIEEKASADAIYQQKLALKELEEVQLQNLKQAEAVKYRNLGMDALGSQGSVPLVQGPTQIGDQQLKEQQLKEQELQTAMDAINRSFSELSSYNPAFSDMIANVSNLGLAFHQMGERAQTWQQVAAQGMSTVASMLNMVSQQMVSSFDQQIAAEKERDGKSEESKKKLQKLEAEKAAAQKKAQTEQIVMQTAMGITQALATLPPPVSYAMAATTQLMGQQALKSQQSGSAIASVGEASVPSLSLGERDNRIDVSRSASAGELQYIQGGNGVGNASDFKPRAVGNRAPANHQVLVGENGPEVVAFDTPGMITAQNQASGSSYGSNFNVTIQALDSESLQSYLQKNGQIFASSMEYTLNDVGYSLYRK